MNITATQSRAFPPEFMIALGESAVTFQGTHAQALADEYVAFKNNPVAESPAGK